jgi:hypothetical protein
MKAPESLRTILIAAALAPSISCNQHEATLIYEATYSINDACLSVITDYDQDGYDGPIYVLSPQLVSFANAYGVDPGAVADWCEEQYSIEDCWDFNPEINPSATEIWYDGIDQNCDEKNDYDADGDGYASDAHAEEGDKRGGTDCDDSDEFIYPGALEVVDEEDNDCDKCYDEELGVCDEDIPEANYNDPIMSSE